MTQKRPRRPSRRKLDDRLLIPDGHEQRFGITIDHMLAPLDRVGADLDRKWGGADRVCEMLPTEPPAHVPAGQHDAYRSLVRRYGEVIEELNRAIAEADADAVEALVPRAIKALRIMDHHATKAGVQPPEPLIALIDIDGRRVGVVQEGRDMDRAARDYPGVELFTARDCAVALVRMKDGMAMLGEAKRLWPDVEWGDVRDREPNPEPNDPIPFGDD